MPANPSSVSEIQVLIIRYFCPQFQILARSGREQRNENLEIRGGDGLDGGIGALLRRPGTKNFCDGL
jgi:hypothetical protein